MGELVPDPYILISLPIGPVILYQRLRLILLKMVLMVIYIKRLRESGPWTLSYCILIKADNMLRVLVDPMHECTREWTLICAADRFYCTGNHAYTNNIRAFEIL